MKKITLLILLLTACMFAVETNAKYIPKENCGFEKGILHTKYVDKYNNREGALHAAHMAAARIIKPATTYANVDKWLVEYRMTNVVCMWGDGVTNANIYISIVGKFIVPRKYSKSGKEETVYFKSSVVLDDIKKSKKFHGVNNVTYIVYDEK